MAKKIKRVFCAVLVLFYLIFLPLNSYALTYNDFLTATAVGKTAVEVASRSQLARFIASRGVLRVAGSLSGYLLLAVTVYSVYDYLKDRWQVGATLPNPNFTSVSMATGDIQSWGSQTSYFGTYACSWVHRLMPDIYACGSAYFTKSWHWQDYTQPCAYANNLSNYVPTGGKTSVQLDTPNQPYYDGSCTPGKQVGTWNQYTVTTTVYYMPTNLSSGTLPITWPSPVTDTSDSPANNTKAIVSSIHTAQQNIVEQLQDIKNKLVPYAAPSPDPVGSPTPVPDVPNPWPDTPESSYVPLDPSEYTIKNLDPVKESAPTPYDFSSSSNTPPPDKSAPPVSNGSCGDYQYKNNWDSIKSEISSAINALPLFALINKLSTLTGSAGFPHQYTLDFSRLGWGRVELNLDAWYFMEVLAVLRWSVIAAGFFVAWRLAIGGD